MSRNKFSAGFAALLLAPTVSFASVNWEWSFTQSNVNLAQSASIYVTVTNLLSSDEDIVDAHIDLSSFGRFGGVLVDPANGNLLTPVILGPITPIAPGQSLTFEAMKFFFSGRSAPGLPSSGFEQAVRPSMAISARGCRLFSCQETQISATALTLTYAPVPEPETWGLWFAGLAALVGLTRRRR